MSERCDVAVAHSPPATLFAAGSPPELSAVFYQNLRLVMPRAQSPSAARRCNARATPVSPRVAAAPEDSCSGGGVVTVTGGEPKSRRAAAGPRRPCLVNRADSDGSLGSSSSSSSDENEPASPTRRKKKVVFADDRGLSLTQVRLMNEPSNQPPKLMSAGPYLLNQNQPAAAAAESSPVEPRWRVRFPQPASNYLDFRRRLDTDNVSLENVIVRHSDRRIVGTVKVRNVSYDKLVFVRSTEDGWITHRDTACTYVRNNGVASAGGRRGKGTDARGTGTNEGGGADSSVCSGVTAIYDTFSFRLQLPAAADAATVEFAVCYKCDDFECWDNNSGRNYRLSVDSGADETHASASTPVQTSAIAIASAATAADRFDSVGFTFDCAGATSTSHDQMQQTQQQQQQSPVHYFGAHSRQNSWTSWRDQRANTSAYW